MRDADRWDRIAPLFGVLGILLGVIGNVIARKGEPEDFPGDTEEIVQHFTDEKGAVIAGSWIALIGSLLLFWFVGALWSRLRAAEGRAGRLSATAFGGGVAGVTCFVLAHALHVVPALRVEEHDIVDPAYATALWDASQAMHFAAAPIAFAVLLGAAGVVALRTGFLARWFGAVSLLIAAGLAILPIAWLVLLLAVIWIVVVSIWLFMRGPEGAAPPGGTAPAATGRTTPA